MPATLFCQPRLVLHAHCLRRLTRHKILLPYTVFTVHRRSDEPDNTCLRTPGTCHENIPNEKCYGDALPPFRSNGSSFYSLSCLKHITPYECYVVRQLCSA